LREQNELKDEEIAFLRERLQNLREMYEEMQLLVDSMKPPMLSPTRKVPVPAQLAAEAKDSNQEKKRPHLFGKKKK
jgi:hypothetical protein